MDASIIFSDILVMPQAMGMDCKMVAGKGQAFDEYISTYAVDARHTHC